MTQELAPVRIEITEDATAGISIRLHNNGHFPDLLKGIPKHIVRRARPWLWNSYERRVLVKARSLTWQGRRLVRQMLIAERAKALMARELQPKRVGWLARRLAARAAGRDGAARAAAVLPQHRVTARIQTGYQSRSKMRAQPVQREVTDRSQQDADTRLPDMGRAAPIALAEQLVREAQAVAGEPQVREPGREDTLHAEVLRLAGIGQAQGVHEPQSLAEQMLSKTALTGLRASPLPREEGQQRSR